MIRKLKEIRKSFDKQMDELDATVIKGVERANEITVIDAKTGKCIGEEEHLGLVSDPENDQKKAAQRVNKHLKKFKRQKERSLR